ncbi:sporulation protein [Cytobacillus sp. S13-E01]|uniref:sporulation protein n=1 Tax=Cytobacillus sp. S13-E01 TaxID=3031326 RepID=UPI0023D84E27|nr:sporulation protein [Cytobacillus sp. S13-E01]MDF0725667.1 sporulation protein [Cytobacillus sp. S13-E01]
MSLFNKVFASVGIGSAKVDTKLYEGNITAGEEVRGVVEITGGNIAQEIDEIYLSLNTNYIKERNDSKINQHAIIDTFQITESFTIGANEKREFPFTYRLPVDSPITMGRTKVWIQTGLDIKNAIDPTDRDFIEVKPSPLVTSVLSALTDLGFRLREAKCEEAPYKLRKRLPFIQEFEFIPTSGEFRGKLDEIEVIFFPQSSQTVEVIMEVDRRARGLGSFLAEALEMDESVVRFTVATSDLPQLSEKIYNLVKRFS